MNRRQKIIVSVTGIFIVLLILIGLTYAYFLTRITGNSNPNSISVTTANLELVYGDGTTALLTSNTPIEPGKFSSSKDFTVTNNGNVITDYAVTLEDFSVTYANDTVINGQPVSAGTVTKMEYPSDMKMEITCTIESKDDTRNGTSCGIKKGTLPTHNDILYTNSVKAEETHKYVLTLTYEDSGIDQSLDMNKMIKGKIDIIDLKSTIDLSGTVASYQTGDYVEINSTPIRSEIVDGTYKIIGVEPGNHTLNVKYKDTNGDIKTRGTANLIIQKGTEETVSENVITFTDISREATIDLNSNYTLNISEQIKEYKDFYDNIVKAIAHSQYMGVPENSLYTYQAAIDNDIRYVEFDIYFTSDNIPVLSHDATINRIARNTDGSELSEEINIADVTYSELLNYDFGIYKGSNFAGTKILKFEDIIAFCKENGLHPYIELKNVPSDEQAQILTSIVNNYGISSKATWISFGNTPLKAIKNIDKNARLGLIVTDLSNDSIANSVIDMCNSLKTGSNEVFINSRDYSAKAVSVCKEAGIPMEVWVINDIAVIKNLDPYISGVTSDKYHAGKYRYYSESGYQVVRELSASDIEYQKCLSFSSPYNYTTAAKDRSAYTEFIPIESGYIYKFEFSSTVDSNIATQFYNKLTADLVSNTESISNCYKDLGWKNNGFTYETTEYISGSKPQSVRIQFKDTTGTATENFITGVTISRKRIQ